MNNRNIFFIEFYLFIFLILRKILFLIMYNIYNLFVYKIYFCKHIHLCFKIILIILKLQFF